MLDAERSVGTTSGLMRNRPASGEAPFGIGELFFSRTDPRGVIEAFNQIFLRVADYDAHAMLKAPHRLIRHDDMPKGVFRILWDGIQAGHPVGAYVKNRARDGLYYWVYALVTPVEGGYISVRMKPSSALFPAVTALYAKHLQRERDEKLDSAASAEALLAELRQLGFGGYGSFQAQAIAAETQARDNALHRNADHTVNAMLNLRRANQAIRTQKDAMTEHMIRMQRVPINMRIIAARIERAGGPISAISDSYRRLSEEVTGQLQRFLHEDAAASTFEAGSEETALFLYCAARLADEASAAFAAETAPIEGVDVAQEQTALHGLKRRYCTRAGTAVEQLALSAARVQREISSLRRALVAMDSIRIMSRVEAGRMAQRHDGLASIVETLDSFHARIDDHLAAIAVEAQRMHMEAEDLTTAF